MTDPSTAKADRGPDWPLTRSELARLHHVEPSTVIRALAKAAKAPQTDPSIPPPPQPVNPGAAQPRYHPAEFAAWWPHRPRPGRRH
ncbi:hypothetical protein ACFWXO_05100 [Kitasatospora sp. NPDC059088]|uniref:hypothetical protein n=1 Tax=Kitasatospora sp. NPDC059088 TaxID=3346722 RepID=UPI0036970D47